MPLKFSNGKEVGNRQWQWWTPSCNSARRLGFPSWLSSPSTAADSWNLKHGVCVSRPSLCHSHILSVSCCLSLSQMRTVDFIFLGVTSGIIWNQDTGILSCSWSLCSLVTVHLSQRIFFLWKKLWPSSFSTFLKVFKICSAMSPEKQTSNVTSVPWNTAWNVFLVCLYRIHREDLRESRLN